MGDDEAQNKRRQPGQTREDKSDYIQRGGHPGEQDINTSKLPKLPSGPGPGSDTGTKGGGGSAGED
jgi:hypothetical protein